MNAPSIKGTGMATAVADVLALVESGKLSREALEARLEARDLAILQGKVLPGDWYPIDSYGRLLDLLCDVDGGGRPEYHVARGRRAIERILASGIYHQLEKAQKVKAEVGSPDREAWTRPVVRLMLTLAPALFNFTRWSYAAEPGETLRFALEIAEARAMPDAGRYTLQGVVEFAAARLLERPVHVTSRRPSPDLIVLEARAEG